MTKLVSLHVNIPKEDYEFMVAFSPNHGDLTKMVRHLIHVFCKEIREGGRIILPPEIRVQLERHTDADSPSEEDSDEQAT